MFCTHAQGGVSVVESSGNLRPCCMAKTGAWENINDDTWNKYPTIFEVDTLNDLHKQKPYTNIQSELELGHFPETCSWCEIEENKGFESRRQHTNKYFNNNNLYVENTIQDLEIALDMTCNMMCRMCNPGQSSKWGAAKSVVKELNKYEMVVQFDETNTEYRSYQKQMKHILSNTDLSYARVIKIEGGEPFYSKNLEWFLDKLISEVDNNKFTLFIVSNCSIYPNEKIVNKLKWFNDVTIICSIDAIEELAECIRWGVDWKTIDNNICKFKNPDDMFTPKLLTNSVISILNFNKLEPLIKYTSDRNFNYFDVNYLGWPEHLSIYQLPKSVRIKYLSGNKGIDDILSADIKIKPQLDKTLKHIELLDDYTGYKFKSINKEVMEILNE